MKVGEGVVHDVLEDADAKGHRFLLHEPDLRAQRAEVPVLDSHAVDENLRDAMRRRCDMCVQFVPEGGEMCVRTLSARGRVGEHLALDEIVEALEQPDDGRLPGPAAPRRFLSAILFRAWCVDIYP